MDELDWVVVVFCAALMIPIIDWLHVVYVRAGWGGIGTIAAIVAIPLALKIAVACNTVEGFEFPWLRRKRR